jgi:predicted Zn finger-like uncharacterized protein
MAKLEPARFMCPNCNAEYRIVRVTADPTVADREIRCRSCGGPLQGREGNLVLKYFFAETAVSAARS